MKKILVIVLLMCSPFASAVNYNDKKIGIVRSIDWRPCIFFQLEGVAEADDTNSPWFTVSKDHIGFNEIFSMILASKMSGKDIHVGTSGTSACGHATVQVIHIP